MGFHIFENRFSLSIWYVILIIENRRGGPVRQGRDDDSQRCRPLHYHCPRGEQPNLLCVGWDVWQKGKDTVSWACRCKNAGISAKVLGYVSKWWRGVKTPGHTHISKKAHQGFQVSGIHPHGNFIQIWVITQSNVELLHGLLIQRGYRRIGWNSLVNLFDGFLIMVNCSVP